MTTHRRATCGQSRAPPQLAGLRPCVHQHAAGEESPAIARATAEDSSPSFRRRLPFLELHGPGRFFGFPTFRFFVPAFLQRLVGLGFPDAAFEVFSSLPSRGGRPRRFDFAVSPCSSRVVCAVVGQFARVLRMEFGPPGTPGSGFLAEFSFGRFPGPAFGGP
jgi:hypothetical protein